MNAEEYLNRPPAIIIQAGKAKSEMLAEAVLKGCGGAGIILREPEVVPDSHTPFVIGAWRTTASWLHKFSREHRTFGYMDNGYFRPYKKGGYFRATLNGLQHFSSAPPVTPESLERWNGLGHEIKPWRHEDLEAPILITLQTPQWFDMMGLSREEWLRKTLTWIESSTDRPIRVRDKPLKGSGPTSSLQDDLRYCWAVVALSSNSLIEALMEGVPVFPTDMCAAWPLGFSDLSMIETPYFAENRLEVFCDLAMNQWTIEEIESGLMWRQLAATADRRHERLA